MNNLKFFYNHRPQSGIHHVRQERRSEDLGERVVRGDEVSGREDHPGRVSRHD